MRRIATFPLTGGFRGWGALFALTAALCVVTTGRMLPAATAAIHAGTDLRGGAGNTPADRGSEGHTDLAFDPESGPLLTVDLVRPGADDVAGPDKPMEAGRGFSLRLRLANEGQAPAADVRWIIFLPVQLRLVSTAVLEARGLDGPPVWTEEAGQPRGALDTLAILGLVRMDLRLLALTAGEATVVVQASCAGREIPATAVAVVRVTEPPEQVLEATPEDMVDIRPWPGCGRLGGPAWLLGGGGFCAGILTRRRRAPKR